MTGGQAATRAANAFKKAVAILTHEAANPPKAKYVPDYAWLKGYEAGRLLWDILMHAESLVPLLNTDDDANTDDLRRFCNELQVALRRHQLAAKLRNTTGRTPEEAAAFEAKAEELS